MTYQYYPHEEQVTAVDSDISTVSWQPYPTQRGWECPKCGRIFGPHVTECHYCNSIDPHIEPSIRVVFI